MSPDAPSSLPDTAWGASVSLRTLLDNEDLGWLCAQAIMITFSETPTHSCPS